MSKAFRSLFKKRESKDDKNKQNSATKGIIYIEAEPRNQRTAKEVQIRKYKQRQRRSSDSLSNDPVYLSKQFNKNKGGIIKRCSNGSEDKYISLDRGSKFEYRERKYDNSIYSKNAPMVYTASVTRDSTSFRQKQTSRPSEPFPYQVYDPPVPRRSTLYYGVDFDGKPLNADGSSRYASFDDYLAQSASQSDGFNVPNEQNFEDDLDRSPQNGHRVTIVAPSDKGDNYENETSDFQNKPVRNTILRFRPHSSANRTPRESVKLMVFRADQAEPAPLVIGRHVHDIPLKKVKHTPVLVTDDGQILKPLHRESRTRASQSVNNEASQVRLSLADIDRVRKIARKSTETMHPTYHSRNSVNRNSVRQSLVSRENERRPSMARESFAAPETYFHYNLVENKPMVYAVPVIPSRNRSHSLLERHSTTKYGSKQHEIRESLNYPYSVDSRQIIDDESRFSTVMYPADGVKTRKGKSIVVYEVHNLQEIDSSKPKKSIDKNSEKRNTKSSKNEAKELSTNQPEKPKIETIYQDPKTHQGPISKIKSKLSFKNRFSIEKSTESVLSDSKPKRQQHSVASEAEVPLINSVKPENKNTFSFNKKWKTPVCEKEKMENADYCGLACETHDKDKSLYKQRISNNKGTSSHHQANLENDIDFLCYPAETIESDSKLKWRIIIRKEQC